MGDGATDILIPDAPQGVPRRVDPKAGQRRKRPGHEPLATGLVDRAGTRFKHEYRQPAGTQFERGRQANRAAAGDDHIGIERATHVVRSAASARFAVGMRKPNSKIALSTVKAIAVIHAECTSGKAMPSMATIQ